MVALAPSLSESPVLAACTGGVSSTGVMVSAKVWPETVLKPSLTEKPNESAIVSLSSCA